MSLKLLVIGLLATVHANPTEIMTRDDCNPCNPQGASGTDPPTVGGDLKSLYVDLLASVKDINFRKRWSNQLDAREDGFCCRQSLDCVNVQNLNIPACYDKFTTNYAFADGSFGSLTTGNYTQGGSQADLLTGQYTKEGGETGNIYADDQAAKPNTATLSIPPQWTGTGVGSAIPVTEIGSVVMITTTVGGTIVSTATTLPMSNAGSSTATQSASASAQATPSASASAAAQAATGFNKSFGLSFIAALMYAAHVM